MDPFHTETLPNGLTIELFDRSNRYFGDYWHLDLEARCQVSLAAAGLAGEELTRASGLVGETVEYRRRLEKMGVPTAEVAATRDALVASFLASARSYLGSPGFPGRLVRGRLEEARRPQRPYLVR